MLKLNSKTKVYIIFFIFILYAIVTLNLFSHKFFRNIWGIKAIQPYSKVELLKLFTYNDKNLYNGTENCLINNTDEKLCIYQFLAPKKVKDKKRILLGVKKMEVMSFLMILPI